MRRAELSSVGKRLAQLRAPRSQKDQAAALGVPERTYQTYEQDSRTPDLRTLTGVFLQGWDLNWVLFGAGAQRLDPRAVVQWLIFEMYPPSAGKTAKQIAAEVAANYGTARFPVPAWVLEELDSLSEPEAEILAGGGWQDTWPPKNDALDRLEALESKALSVGEKNAEPPSHSLSDANLTIAIELADRSVGDGWLPRPLYAKLVRLLYEGVTQGLPVAQVLSFGRRISQAMEEGGDIDDGEPQLGAASGRRAG